MATFVNPNEPPQPQQGVYAWYAKKNDRILTIYIGQAGYKNTCLPKGTLFRGISELQRNTFTSNSPKYDILDTDFIVGTVIKYFEANGYECMWEHISNNPINEREFVKEKNPILQGGNGDILNRFKIKSSTSRWKLTPDSVHEAENKIFQQLSQVVVQTSPDTPTN
jgi:hypothetical protein